MSPRYITAAEYVAKHGKHQSAVDDQVHYGPQDHCQTCRGPVAS